ncbi:uncharacterized protein LOC107852827 [Capsicum annuum]|uniref:uncharacterized protein LOC107852827 n=1 Tax=Capsicum annuum TaxID=4072 RepID=UPI001FB04E10|nr:uncharacterized protein LOC107852827 [Capsicum annuum]
MASSSILVPIMLQYEGEWLSDVQFEKFTINGVLLNSDCRESSIGNLIETSPIAIQVHPIPIFDYTIEDEEMEEQTESIIKDPLYRDVEEGHLYMDKNTISSVMKHYAIHEKFQFKVKRSSSSRYYLKCINQRCNWTFRSSSQKNSEVFMVTKFVDDHTCPIADRMLLQRHATSLTIAKMVKHNFLNLKSTYTLAEIMEEMRNLYGIRINYKKAYRAKEKALELVRGSLRESYAKLPSYLFMVNTINPGSFTKLHKTEDNHFLYAFIALSTSIRGWRYCMPIIVVDGTFLKSAYKGTMLSASVLDAAGYAVVDFENDVSWEWFFRMFNTAFGEREGMCIVSNSHDSILKAAALVYLNVAHCICIYHLWNNIKGRFKMNQKQLKGIFFTMARTYIKADFDRLMEDINKIDNRVKEYLFDIGYEKWFIAHAHVNRSMFMTSNIAKSLNSANRDARDLPIKKFL